MDSRGDHRSSRIPLKVPIAILIRVLLTLQLVPAKQIIPQQSTWFLPLTWRRQRRNLRNSLVGSSCLSLLEVSYSLETRVRDVDTRCLALVLANGILPYDPYFNPDLHAPITSFDPIMIVNTQTGLRESWDPLIPNDYPSVASTSTLAHPNANEVNPSVQPVSAPDEALLAEFCKSNLAKSRASSAHLTPVIFVTRRRLPDSCHVHHLYPFTTSPIRRTYTQHYQFVPSRTSGQTSSCGDM